MNDLRLELRVRNNVLWHAIFDVAPSVAEFCRRFGFLNTVVGSFLNITKSPYGRWGDLVATARRLCDVTGFGAEELFPALLYNGVLTRNNFVAEVSSVRFIELTAAKQLALPPHQEDGISEDELHAAIEAVLQTVSPREARILRARVVDDRSLSDISREEGVGTERIRQIEMKALRKLRHPSRLKTLTPFWYRDPYDSSSDDDPPSTTS